MRLNRLSLRQFKGVESFDFTPNGQSGVVLGRNSTGKSTLLDAYSWLLFGKDSRGSASFEVRPLVEGEPMHRGEHAVEAEFVTDSGDLITLKRVLTEKWVRVRGKAFQEYKGTETSYYVNGAPVKAADYNAAVSDLFGGEKNAQLLSDPLYFAGSMPWQERRRILLDLVGEVSTRRSSSQTTTWPRSPRCWTAAASTTTARSSRPRARTSSASSTSTPARYARLAGTPTPQRPRWSRPEPRSRG